MKEIKLNLGCGVYIVSGFINVDKNYTLKQLQSKKGLYKNAVIEKGAQYVRADMTALPFKDNFADYIESIDVIEHLPYRQVQKAFNEMARVIKPKGKICLLTTNFDNLAELWLNNNANKQFNINTYEELTQLIYGNQVGPGQFHTAPFNPYILKHFFEASGLTYKMTMYPYNTTAVPPFKTQVWSTSSHTRSDMIWVEAHK